MKLRQYKVLLQGNVFYLGLTSLLTDMSSEMVYPLLPLFIAGVVPAGYAGVYIGLMEGIAESTASLLKLFSGYITDKIAHRKAFTTIGYFISTICRLFIAFSHTGIQVIFFRFLDRVGKGIRTSPRDALLSESVDSEHRGIAFSFHRLMDHTGAILGPLIAILLLYIIMKEEVLPYVKVLPEQINLFSLRIVFLFSVLPGLIAVLTLIFFVKDIYTPTSRSGSQTPNSPIKNKPVPKPFYIFLLSVCVFTLGNSSDLFLVYYGSEKFGYGPYGVILAWVLLHLSKVLFSLPGGELSDRYGRTALILLGWGIYTIVYLGMSVANTSALFWILLCVYGAYYGCTEGVEKALVTDLTPIESRGFAFGLYHCIVGISTLPASLIFGILWSIIGPSYAFLIGASLSLSAILIFLWFNFTYKKYLKTQNMTELQ